MPAKQPTTLRRIHRRVARRREMIDPYVLQTLTAKTFYGINSISELRARWNQIGQDDKFWNAIFDLRQVQLEADKATKVLDTVCQKIGKRPLQ